MEPPAQRFMIFIIDLFKDLLKNLANIGLAKLQTHLFGKKAIQLQSSGKKDCDMKSLSEPIDDILCELRPTSHSWFIVVSNVYPKTNSVYHFQGKCNCMRTKCWFNQFKLNEDDNEFSTEFFNQSKDIICMENLKATAETNFDRNNNSLCFLKYKPKMMIEFTNTLLPPLSATQSNTTLHRSRSRERISSASDSDDSFICFLDDNDWVMQDNDEDDIDNLADDFDSTNSSMNKDCKTNEQNSMDKSDEDLPRNKFQKKKVRFNLKPEVHVMHQWNFAYRSARKGNWEEIARDRFRFQLRINRAAAYLDPILSSSHRSCVYNNRFSNEC